MITSLSNPKVQLAHSLARQKKARVKENAFLVEGVRLVEESLKQGGEPHFILFTPNPGERGKMLLDQLADRGVPLLDVADHVMASISDTETSQGILGVYPMRHRDIHASADFFLILDEVRDPGNAGTLLRSAWAAGADAVFLMEGTVDVYSPKVVRSAMGAHFSLPLAYSSWGSLENLFPTKALPQFIVSVVENGTSLWQCDFCRPTAVVIGGEAEGASARARATADQMVTIPMAGQSESLNAAVAGSILLFEVLRQRSQPGRIQ